MTTPLLSAVCERCQQPYMPPVNRPTWALCEICSMGGLHARSTRFGPAPAYALPPATAAKVTFIIPGPPLSVNRVHGFGFRKGKRVMYYTEQGKRYKSSVALHALSAVSRVQWDKTRRYSLRLLGYYDNARADSDNPLKVIKDALQGVLYDNDVQVVSDYTEKILDKVAPRMVVTVEAIGG